MDVSYTGSNLDGQRTYLVNNEAHVEARDESEWVYWCQAHRSTDCHHIEAVCIERAKFERADSLMGQGF